MWAALIGTVIFGACLVAGVLWMLFVAVRHLDDGRDEITQPHQAADRLGALTNGQVFTDTAQRRADAKRRLQLVASKDRGRARLMTFLPKDVA